VIGLNWSLGAYCGRKSGMIWLNIVPLNSQIYY
jgi:hypothetical protein